MSYRNWTCAKNPDPEIVEAPNWHPEKGLQTGGTRHTKPDIQRILRGNSKISYIWKAIPFPKHSFSVLHVKLQNELKLPYAHSIRKDLDFSVVRPNLILDHLLVIFWLPKRSKKRKKTIRNIVGIPRLDAHPAPYKNYKKYLTHPIINGSFNWMLPNLYI